MGNLLSLENCQKYPSCEYCGTFPTDDNHVLLVHHKGKLNGRYVCTKCLNNPIYRREQYIIRKQENKTTV